VLSLAILAGEASAGTPYDTPLRFGIVPFNSAAALSRIHRPLNRHLSAMLQRSVAFYTSVDHAVFFKDASAGVFDLMVVSPHFVPFLVKNGFVPLARYRSEIDIVLVMRRDFTFNSLSDLRDKRLGFPDRLSFTTINSMLWLGQRGMEAGRDFSVQLQPSLNAAVTAVAVEKLDMAITATSAFNQLSPDVRARLKTRRLNETPQPSLMILAKESLGETNLARIRTALDTFPATAAGAAFFRETGYIGFAPVSEANLGALSAYVEITKKNLGQ
jgi:phosphonate transport system substrate-binding protein